MKQRWWLIAAIVLSALFAHAADADINLPIVCDSCQAGEPAGSPASWNWRTPVASDLVLVADGPGNWNTGTWQAWGSASTFVRACPQNVPQGSTNCSGDDFLPRSTWPPIEEPPVQYSPQFNLFTAEPRVVAPGGQVEITWDTQDMAGCSSSWRPEMAPPNSGSDRINIATETVVQISCTGLGGSSHIVAHRIRIQEAAVLPQIECVPYVDTRASPLRTANTTQGQTVYAWGCDMLTGYQWVQRALDPSRKVEELSCLNPAWLAALTLDNARSADAACTHGRMSQGETDVAIALTARWKARFAVQGGGTIIRRPVYTRNADGTRGAQLRVGNVLQYVLVGVPCNGGSRLVGITTRYHSVAGETSQQGAVIPADSFAQCMKSDPPVGGW